MDQGPHLRIKNVYHGLQSNGWLDDAPSPEESLKGLRWSCFSVPRTKVILLFRFYLGLHIFQYDEHPASCLKVAPLWKLQWEEPKNIYIY